MKLRFVLRVVVFLAMGAVLNVLVAWGCVCWSWVGMDIPTRAVSWDAPVSDDWPAPAGRHVRLGIGLTESHTFGDAPIGADLEERQSTKQWMLGAGWPCRSLFRERHRVERASAWHYPLGMIRPRVWTDGLMIPKWVPWCDVQGISYLPTRVFPAGFAIDSVFYAGVSALIGLALGAARRCIRRACGRCTACGYDLRENVSGVCPECGAGVSPTGSAP